jgi:hypothetical protein
MTVTSTGRSAAAEADLAVLEQIQQRVLWLATRIVDAANHDRDTGDGVKVGGHQASSASLVSAMTALYFSFLDAPDKVSVKPHASPVYHAIQYLLGNLDRSYLTTLRAFGGLQAYPSRTKDPDSPDFSTGSVHRADRRRRAGRGQHLGGGRRPGHRRPRLSHVDHRPEPAVTGPGGSRSADRPVGAAVHRGRLACGRG